ncbi:hypothetical protein DTL42_11335 [Bremerella cremea]|uniref:Probable inorganic carbon transporter subunit DabB n=1 Tax=Bremerella cremea TaxID=1031537 RepID=A0A368KT66_9BACT|nr:proton-conducting transporter membrane subunit [Bremerella cremea]RCS49129.1 hypothetical protein DTL42_11335 [Bremerella cremea]
MPIPPMLIYAAPFVLVLALAIPSSWANRHAALMRRVSYALVSVSGVWFSLFSVLLFFRGEVTDSWTWGDLDGHLKISIYYDRVSALIALLISYVGWIITRYAYSYMNGDAKAGYFHKWLMVCLGAILGLVISGNLIQLFAFWVLTSVALHKLLTHYSDRSWAMWTARKKFLISRLGDLFLGIAIYLVYRLWGTGELSQLFARFQSGGPGAFDDPLVAPICILLVLSALTKSAQFPFHSWLPDTLETPTPVSALMHAGIINGGGFLLIRLSPLVSQSSSALTLCTAVGGGTCLLGGVIMMTQSSIKKKLAYSTMSQMGFMMLQCGLGAFSIALIHIIFHSLYKSHAFLRSGSAVTATPVPQPDVKGMQRFYALAFGMVISLGIIGGFLWATDTVSIQSASGLLLGLVLILALTYLIADSIATGSPKIVSLGIATAIFTGGIYFLSHKVLAQFTAEALPHETTHTSLAFYMATAVVAIGFLTLAVLQLAIIIFPNARPVQVLYVHAINGFYFDIAARRVTAMIWGKSAPTP